MSQSITALDKTPLNRLFVAINHYISTGDHIGEGIAVPEGPQRHTQGEPHPDDKLRVLLMVNTTDPVDRSDFEKFKSRFSQLEKGFGTRLEDGGRQAHFAVNSFVIQYKQTEPLAQALTEQPGPAGWGSMKPLIDKHFPG